MNNVGLSVNGRKPFSVNFKQSGPSTNTGLNVNIGFKTLTRHVSYKFVFPYFNSLDKGFKIFWVLSLILSKQIYVDVVRRYGI